MCCRINTSSPYINGLMILLTTFLVGFFAVQIIAWLDQLTLSEVETTELNTIVQGPKEFNSCNNEDGISMMVYYEFTYENQSLSPELGVSNHGSEPLYFFVDNEGNLVYDLLHANRTITAETGNRSSTHEIELRPGVTASCFLPANDNEKSFSVRFIYRREDLSRSLVADFSSSGFVPYGCY